MGEPDRKQVTQWVMSLHKQKVLWGKQGSINRKCLMCVRVLGQEDEEVGAVQEGRCPTDPGEL